MKYIYFIFLAFFCFAQNGLAQPLYNSEGITLIEITFDNANWDQQLDDLYAADNNDRLFATVEINGESFDSVGVRYRGGATYAADQGKNPLNIKLDFIKNHDYQGYETLRLNNGAKDPSFVREVLTSEIGKEYMPTPQANYAKVFINGTYHGLYVNVENVDKDFVGNTFLSDRDNTFFDCSPDGNIDPPLAGCTEGNASSLEYLGASVECYKDYYDKTSTPASGWEELVALANAIDQGAANIETLMNMDRAIWMSAMNNLLVNLDSYLGEDPANYFLFRDDNDRFNSLMWNFKESFGGNRELENGEDDLTLAELQTLDPLLRMNAETYPLLKLILENPTYKRQYIAHFRTMLNETINSGAYATRAQDLVNLISSDVAADPNKIYTVAQFNDNLNSTVTIDFDGDMIDVPGIAELMNERLTFLLGHAEFVKTPPSISNIGNVPLNVTPNSTVTITAEVSGASYVYVGYRNNLTEVFQKVEMLDDGNNNDGTAGDGIYGGNISVGVEGAQYYIYAEDATVDVGMFSPEKAEEEYYTLATFSDVVINELMASNATTVADQDGEFEDWVELYNNTNTGIDLNGYYLTDDATDLMKYQFPNVTIDGNGYIIVWLDSDLTQQGLHADFKLSATGEELLLVNSNLQVVDKVVFGAQETDVSFARIPNGTGEFVSRPPTFNTNNGQSTNTTDLAATFGLEIYPNPAQDFVTLHLKNKNLLTVDLYNAFGQRVKRFDLEGKMNLEVSDLGSGVYWLGWEGRFLGRVVLVK